MTRLPVRIARVTLMCAVMGIAIPPAVFTATSAWAQDAAPAAPAATPTVAASAAPAAPAPAAAAPVPAVASPAEATPASAATAAAPDEDLQQAVENFWHYAKVFRYDLALEEAQKVLAKKENPVEVLKAFEKTAEDHNDNLDQYLIRWQGTKELKDVTSQIITVLNEGRRTRRADPNAIEANVKRLTSTGRGYMLAVRDLRESGELAVPVMIDYLRDPAKAQYHAAIRDALRDIGRPVLNPLVAVTESKSQDVLIPVISVLGDLGYGAAVPYLDRLAASNDASAAVRSAATQALMRMGAGEPRAMNPAELFYQLAEKFYYDNADITADKRDLDAPANVWFWDEQKGLTRKEVPQVIFSDIMAMRACEYSLKLGQSNGDALSLWLASNYKREAQLPAGAKDPTRAENQPSAHFYGVDSGATYLNSALARALRDRNSQVALRVIKSLQEIIGRTNLFSGNAGTGAPALIDAMSSGDRLVRFEAAFAVAAAVPQQSFQGQDRVVPLLAEAMSQTGVPSAIVVEPTQDQANAAADALRQAGYNAVGATTPDQAVIAAAQLPAVDVIIVPEDLGAAQVDRLLLLATQNAKLSGAARLIIVHSGASPYAMRAINDPLLTVSQAGNNAGLKAAADAARAKASSLPIDQTSAASYALRAAELLRRLALVQIQGQTQVLNLSAAEQTVLAALKDSRPDIVKAAGQVLGLMNSASGQGALLQAAVDAKTADDVRVSLLKSLSSSGKFFGQRLSPQQVTVLDQLINSASNQDVKDAAAEARGAMNLPANQAKTLIVQQSQT